MTDDRTINRLKRTTALIDANAKLASPGPWRISHGHVYANVPKKEDERFSTRCFDICSQPWAKSHHTIYGLNPSTDRNAAYKDMRHIATCEPQTMQQLVADVGLLLAEREELLALNAELHGNLKAMRERYE